MPPKSTRKHDTPAAGDPFSPSSACPTKDKKKKAGNPATIAVPAPVIAAASVVEPASIAAATHPPVVMVPTILISTAAPMSEKEVIKLLGDYTFIAFCGSLQGNEVFLVDLYGNKKYLASPEVEDGVVIIPLLGRFKGKTGDRYHLTPLAATTLSGIWVKLWVSRLVETKEGHGQMRGPLFSNH